MNAPHHPLTLALRRASRHVALLAAFGLATAAWTGCGGADEEYSPENNGTSNGTGDSNSTSNSTSNATTGGTSSNTTTTRDCGRHSPGEGWTEGCDYCFCNEDNTATCTVHAPGDTWQVDCNTCACSEENTISCTEADCSRSCDEIEAAYEGAIAANNSCAEDADCAIVGGQCGVGLGGCYESVSVDFSAEHLRALGQEFQASGCTNGVCDCAPPPLAVCDDGVCGFAHPCGEYDWGEEWVNEEGCDCVCAWSGQIECTSCDPGGACGEYDLGDTWEEDCNSCTCTEDGPLCTTEACPPDSCDDIADSYNDLVQDARACDSDDACQLLYGQCGVGIGGCYEAVNMSVSQDDLNALGAAWSEGECFGPVCDCAEPPAVACVEGLCAFTDPPPPACGDYDLGDTWEAEDGCNTCTCTEDGVLCTATPCTNSCEDIEASYNGALEGASSCQTADDCQLLFGQCGVGLGGCYEAANMSLSQDDLAELGAAYSEAQCTSAVCDCISPEGLSPDCVENTCVIVSQ